MPSAQHLVPGQRDGRPTDILFSLPPLIFGSNSAHHHPPPPLYRASTLTLKAANHILSHGDVVLKVDHLMVADIHRSLEISTKASFPRPSSLERAFLAQWDDSLAGIAFDLRDGDGAHAGPTTAIIGEVVRLANQFLGTRFLRKKTPVRWAQNTDWPDLYLLPAKIGLQMWTNAGADTGWGRLLATLGNSSITFQSRAGEIHTKPYAYSAELRAVMGEVSCRPLLPSLPQILFTMHAQRLTSLIITSGPATAIFELSEKGLRVSPLLMTTRNGPTLLTLMVGLAVSERPEPYFIDLRPIGIHSQFADPRPSPSFHVSSVASQSDIPPLPPLPMAPPPLPPAASPPKTPDRVHHTPIPGAPNSKSTQRFHEEKWRYEPGTPSPSVSTFSMSRLSLRSGGSRKLARSKRTQPRPSVSAPDLPHLPDLDAQDPFVGSSSTQGFSGGYQAVPYRHVPPAQATPSRGQSQGVAFPVIGHAVAGTPSSPHTPHTPGSRTSSRMMPRGHHGFPGGEPYEPGPTSPVIPGTDDEDGEHEMPSPSPPPRRLFGPPSTPPSRNAAPPPIATTPALPYSTLKRMRELTPPEPAWDIPSVS